jgi:penicillin-binding protein 1C
VKALAPVHAVPTATCPYHRAYDVERETGRAVLPACRHPDRETLRKSFVVLPSAVTAWLTAHDRAVPEAPVFGDGCAPDSDAPPVLLTPGEGEVVTIVPGIAAQRQAVQLTASAHTQHLAWFVDGALIGTAAASDRMFWTPSPGRHEIVVADDAGRKARRTVQVTGLAQRL